MEVPASQVKNIAKEAWRLMGYQAKEHGTKTTRKDGREGYIVVLKGGSARFIKEAAKEAYNLRLTKGQVDDIREVMKAGDNIRTLGRADGTKASRIFVSDHWQDSAVVEKRLAVRSFNARETGQSPGGETQAPVESNLFEEFSRNPLGAEQAALLALLVDDCGGKYEDRNGFSTTDLGSNSDSRRRLEERGLIKTTMKNQRRLLRLEVTPRGWWAAANLPYIQESWVAIAYELARNGPFVGSTPNRTSKEFSERIHREAHRIVPAAQHLEEQGLLRMERGQGKRSKPISFTWVGGPDDIPGSLLQRHRQELLQPQQPPPTEPEAPKAEGEKGQVVFSQRVLSEEGTVIVDRLERIERILNGETIEDQRVLVYSNALDTIREITSRVEQGQMAALRAIVEIQGTVDIALEETPDEQA